MPLVEKPSLDDVRRAIKTVLTDQVNDKSLASEWLDNFKSSLHAWELCNQLLISPSEGIEVSYLAAHMLRQKISRSFNELPIEYYSSLKDSILSHLEIHEDYAVQGQLTMAIADLTLLLQNWQNPIEDLAKQFNLDVPLSSILIQNQNNNNNNYDYVAIYKTLHRRLVFAYILHQMCDLNHDNSERPHRIGAKRREEFEDYLITKCTQVITWWLNTMKENQELKVLFNAQQAQQPSEQQQKDPLKVKCLDTMDKLIGQIYLCYSAWLRVFDEENVNQSLDLIASAVNHLDSVDCPDAVHKYAVEVIVATASFCEDNRQVDYLVGYLVDHCYRLEPAFRRSVTEEDTEKSTNFVRAITSVAETACLIYVIENKDFKLVDLLLSCLTHYDFEIVSDTYPFWWVFLEHLQTRLKPTEYGPYIPYINKFVMAVTRLCQFDPDEDSIVSDDQDIHQFRYESADIISNVLFVTTVQDFLHDNQVLESFKFRLYNSANNNNNNNANQISEMISWEKNEATLYLISCLVPMTTKEENLLRMQIFNSIMLQQANFTQSIQTLLETKQINLRIGLDANEVHPQIVATTLKIIGSLESFLTYYPDHLALSVNYILNSINDPRYRRKLIKHAAAALCSIMEYNATRHFSHCPEFSLVIKNLCSSLDEFDDPAAIDLLKCGAYMADAISDTTLKDQFLCEIVMQNLNSLKQVLSKTATTLERNENEPSKYLDRLSVVFRQTNIPPATVPEMKNFVILIDSELWPVIVKVLELFASERGHAIERTCRTLRYLIRCVKPEWMISKIAETMISLYRSYPQNSSPLYICSILVDEFANRNPEINQGLFGMLEIFCELTFTLLNMESSQQKSLLTMKSYPETIDDMMRLFNRFLKKCPNEFVNCKALESIIELSISSLRIDHPDANSNVSKFLIAFIQLGQQQQKEYSHISDAIRNVLGKRIVDSTMRACLFDIPSSLIGEEAHILMTLFNFDKNLFGTWVEATVDNLPKTNIQGIESITMDELKEFKETITTASSMKIMVNCLRSFAQLYT